MQLLQKYTQLQQLNKNKNLCQENFSEEKMFFAACPTGFDLFDHMIGTVLTLRFPYLKKNKKTTVFLLVPKG